MKTILSVELSETSLRKGWVFPQFCASMKRVINVGYLCQAGSPYSDCLFYRNLLREPI